MVFRDTYVLFQPVVLLFASWNWIFHVTQRICELHFILREIIFGQRKVLSYFFMHNQTVRSKIRLQCYNLEQTYGIYRHKDHPLRRLSRYCKLSDILKACFRNMITIFWKILYIPRIWETLIKLWEIAKHTTRREWQQLEDLLELGEFSLQEASRSEDGSLLHLMKFAFLRHVKASARTQVQPSGSRSFGGMSLAAHLNSIGHAWRALACGRTAASSYQGKLDCLIWRQVNQMLASMVKKVKNVGTCHTTPQVILANRCSSWTFDERSTISRFTIYNLTDAIPPFTISFCDKIGNRKEALIQFFLFVFLDNSFYRYRVNIVYLSLMYRIGPHLNRFSRVKLRKSL